MDLAARIREARVAKSLTQCQLADAVGVSQQSISYFERGETRPTIDTLIRLAESLSLKPSDLLDPTPVAA